ncbi:hypothetical protein [Peribacillus kribbensis]|uniref:hypothetical protein n=1 Tax=Peribacillus kribbensis TaxID=356658 RepID=UPI00042347FD|nr:hypothetical protein [Peribacillus kribbensis]
MMTLELAKKTLNTLAEYHKTEITLTFGRDGTPILSVCFWDDLYHVTKLESMETVSYYYANTTLSAIQDGLNEVCLRVLN